MAPSTALYGYVPDLPANAFFLLVAAVGLLVTLAVTVRTQKYVAFGSLVSLACVLEVMGYSDRVYSHDASDKVFPFIQGTVTLIIAPGFLTSRSVPTIERGEVWLDLIAFSIYTILGDIARVLGEEHSPLAPRLYARTLISLDGSGLLLQIIGLAIAFSSANPNDGIGPRLAQGLYVAAAGLTLQLTALVASLALIATLLARAAAAVRKHGYTTFHRDAGYVPLTGRFKALLAAVPAASTALLTRLLFRIAELSRGRVCGDEGVFIGLESAMVGVAVALITASHPAVLLRDGRGRGMARARGKAGGGSGGGADDDDGGVPELEAVAEVARQSGDGLLGRSWSLRSWRSLRAGGRRQRPVEGLRTTMCAVRDESVSAAEK